MLALLQAMGLTKQFRGLVAVDDVNFVLKPGEILGIIGPNGAGKTTLFNAISGFYPPTRGKVIFEGKDITGLKANRTARLGLVRTFQLVNLIDDETVFENVRIAHYLQRRKGALASVFHMRAAREDEKLIGHRTKDLMERMGLLEYGDETAQSLPHGLQRLLGVCLAMAAEPKLLLVDEPTAGLSASEAVTIIEHILRIRREGVTVMVVEHDMKVIMSICDRILVLNFGRKIAEGTPKEVSSNETVISAYLGPKNEGAQNAA